MDIHFNIFEIIDYRYTKLGCLLLYFLSVEFTTLIW